MCKKTLSLIYIHALKCLLRNTFLETPPHTHTQKQLPASKNAVLSGQYWQMHLTGMLIMNRSYPYLHRVWVAADKNGTIILQSPQAMCLAAANAWLISIKRGTHFVSLCLHRSSLGCILPLYSPSHSNMAVLLSCCFLQPFHHSLYPRI